jgi:rRNA maturation RNase YbeY
MSIHFFNEDLPLPKLKKRLTANWLKEVILFEGKRVGEVSFIFCSDAYLLDVNKKFLDHDYYTDVITFDYVEGNVISGDIFISLDRISENANSLNISFLDELNRIMVHGVLHLLGYKDKSKEDKNLMTEREDYFIKLLTAN